MFRSLFGLKQKTSGQFQTITPLTLQQRLQAHEILLILDVRRAEEYATEGHIAGSRLLPLHQLLHRHHELPTDRPIVCVCRSGNRSQVACEQLAALGFANLFNLEGGMLQWRQVGLPVH